MTCPACDEEFDEPEVVITAVETRETPEEGIERCPGCGAEYYELAGISKEPER